MGIEDHVNRRIDQRRKGIWPKPRGRIHDAARPLSEPETEPTQNKKYAKFYEQITSGQDITVDDLQDALQVGEEEGDEEGINKSQFDALVLELVRKQRAENAILKAENEELKGMVTTDSLTGILNRHGFDKELSEAKERLNSPTKEGDEKREAHPGHIQFFIIDADNFKIINDLHGHVPGDRALKLVGSCLKKIAIERGGTAGRIGGDEFVLMQEGPGHLTPDQVQAIATRIQEKLIELILVDEFGKDIGFTVSVGGSVMNKGEDKTLEELKNEADAALYKKKKKR